MSEQEGKIHCPSVHVSERPLLFVRVRSNSPDGRWRMALNPSDTALTAGGKERNLQDGELRSRTAEEICLGGFAVQAQDAAVVRFEVIEDGETRGREARKAAAELHGDLTRYLPDDVLAKAEGDRDKGDPVTLAVLALAVVQSGLITEVVRCVRDWLRRRPSERSIVVRRADGTEFSVDARNVDDGTLAEAIKASAGTTTPG